MTERINKRAGRGSQRRKGASEYQLTCKVAAMLKAAGLLFTHVPSETPDRQRAIWNAKMGVAKGVPDFLVFSTPNIAIELKTKKGVLADEQAEWLAQLEQRGWVVAVCKSAAEVAELISNITQGVTP